MTEAIDAADRLWLADWRRRVAELYAHVRATAASDPEAAWDAWRAEREALHRGHPQSPVPAAEREAFRARHWPYDPALRFVVAIEARPAGGLAGPALALPNSGEDLLAFRGAGRLTLPLVAGPRHLSLYWMEGYSGGLFLPFRDATNGEATYGAGRYVLDTAKGADLGGDPTAGTLVVDLNFAFHPSCAFDPRWACPLAPPENRLDLPVEAGERLR
ncbi:MAG: DUF1684 domain-containing protein [Chloroflexota bacterium]